jgi:hypothetical protein
MLLVRKLHIPLFHRPWCFSWNTHIRDRVEILQHGVMAKSLDKPKLWPVTTWMRSSLVVRASDCQCRSRNSPGFYPSILRHRGIWGAADEAVLKTVHRKKSLKKSPLLIFRENHPEKPCLQYCMYNMVTTASYRGSELQYSDSHWGVMRWRRTRRGWLKSLSLAGPIPRWERPIEDEN